MASPVIYNRGGPVQIAHPGPFTCTQSICSDTACADNSLEFQCLSQVMQGYDISFLGLTMQCDSDSTVYPFMSCTCSEGFVNCDDNGAKEGEGSPSVDGASGYAADITLVGKRGGGVPTMQSAEGSSFDIQTASAIQTAGGITQGTQTIPAVQTAGGGAQESRTKTTPTAPNSPTATGAANKYFGDGLGWQLRLGLVTLVSAELTL